MRLNNICISSFWYNNGWQIIELILCYFIILMASHDLFFLFLQEWLLGVRLEALVAFPSYRQHHMDS